MLCCAVLCVVIYKIFRYLLLLYTFIESAEVTTLNFAALIIPDHTLHTTLYNTQYTMHTDGYENSESANKESFFTIKGHGSGWFNTGDLGGLDDQGYLFISGRTKEVSGSFVYSCVVFFNCSCSCYGSDK